MYSNMFFITFKLLRSRLVPILILTLAINCIIVTDLFAQSMLRFPHDARITDSVYYKAHQNRLSDLQLPNFQTDSSLQAFRYWFFGTTMAHLVEIFMSKDNVLRGDIVIYTIETVDNDKELPTNRIFARRTIIPDEVCREILQQYNDTHLDTLPDQDRIKGWFNGFDGQIHQFELTNSKNYYIKRYWSPNAQKGVPEAKNLLRFVQNLSELLDIGVLNRDFIKQIPFERHTLDGAFSSVSVLTYAEMTINFR
jgi:hypothetical protein